MVAHVRDIAEEPDMAQLIQLIVTDGLNLHILLNVFQIPMGSEYEIVEDSTDGFEVSSQNASGTAGTRDINATFTNKRAEVGDIKVTKKVTGDTTDVSYNADEKYTVAVMLKPAAGKDLSGVKVTPSTATVSDKLGWTEYKAEIKADDISFDFTRRWDVTANGGSSVLSLDTSGNLYIKGELLSGSTIGNMHINGYGIYGDDGDMRTELNIGGLTVYNPYGNALSVTGKVKISGFSGSGSSSKTAIEIGEFSGSDSMIHLPYLPTSKPSSGGYLYRDNGTLKIS